MNFLSSPIRSKLVQVKNGRDDRITMSAVTMQNYRKTMEDFVTLEPHHMVSVAAVFDGHGGAHVARYCSLNLHLEIQNLPEITESSLKDLFMNFNERHFPRAMAGSTASVLVVTRHQVFVIQLGDSRVYLRETDNQFKLTVAPHSPSRDDERKRIESLSNFFVARDRVNGSLAVSRAFGDRNYSPAVIAEPEIKMFPRTGRPMDFVIISDGFLERSNDREVCESIGERFEALLPHLLGIELCEDAVFHSHDNCSIVLVKIDSKDTRKDQDREFGVVEPLENTEDVATQKAFEFDLKRYPLGLAD